MNIRKYSLLCVALGMCASTCFGSISFSTPGGATVGGIAVNANAVVDVVTSGSDSFLKITLTNLATSGQNTQRLTNFEFNLSGATVGIGTGASVNVAAGSSIINGTNPNGVSSTNVSGGWVFGTNVTPYIPAGGAPTFNYGVSASSFISGTQVSRFDGSTNFGNTHTFGQVDGGDWGLLGNAVWGNTNGESIVKSVDIMVKVLTGTLNLSNIGRVAFTYGSEQEGVGGIVDGGRDEDVPEPTTLAIWGLGMGLSLVGARFRRKKANA